MTGCQHKSTFEPSSSLFTQLVLSLTFLQYVGLGTSIVSRHLPSEASAPIVFVTSSLPTRSSEVRLYSFYLLWLKCTLFYMPCVFSAKCLLWLALTKSSKLVYFAVVRSSRQPFVNRSPSIVIATYTWTDVSHPGGSSWCVTK